MAKYLSGWINLGIGGRKRVYLFKNDKRENKNSPVYYIKTRTKNGWKTVGKLYVPRKPEGGNNEG